jgi:transposase
MDVTFSVPTPKTPRKPTSRDERLRCETLYFEARWTQDQIALQLNLTLAQVKYALSHRLTPQRHKCGQKASLNTPQRRQLVEWVTASKDNRRVPWPDIPAILGWNFGHKAIRTAFKKEGFVRRIARKKPPLSYQNQVQRLQWAIEHEDWTEEQWFSVLWSDETWVNPGRHTKDRITRRIGDTEVYHPDCIEPRYQRKIGWMFWGSISGKYGRHKGLFWEKDWEKINEGSYSGIIIPIVQEVMQQYPELQFQQDNAKGHAAAYIKSVFAAIGIEPIYWPPNSPDLNPIETIWDEMKDYIQKHYPQVHQSYKRLRSAVQEAWESITHERIKELVREMPQRCRAVIDAQGAYTKF